MKKDWILFAEFYVYNIKNIDLLNWASQLLKVNFACNMNSITVLNN